MRNLFITLIKFELIGLLVCFIYLWYVRYLWLPYHKADYLKYKISNDYKLVKPLTITGLSLIALALLGVILAIWGILQL